MIRYIFDSIVLWRWELGLAKYKKNIGHDEEEDVIYLLALAEFNGWPKTLNNRAQRIRAVRYQSSWRHFSTKTNDD